MLCAEARVQQQCRYPPKVGLVRALGVLMCVWHREPESHCAYVCIIDMNDKYFLFFFSSFSRMTCFKNRIDTWIGFDTNSIILHIEIDESFGSCRFCSSLTRLQLPISFGRATVWQWTTLLYTRNPVENFDTHDDDERHFAMISVRARRCRDFRRIYLIISWALRACSLSLSLQCGVVCLQCTIDVTAAAVVAVSLLLLYTFMWRQFQHIIQLYLISAFFYSFRAWGVFFVFQCCHRRRWRPQSRYCCSVPRESRREIDHIQMCLGLHIASACFVRPTRQTREITLWV